MNLNFSRGPSLPKKWFQMMNISEVLCGIRFSIKMAVKLKNGRNLPKEIKELRGMNLLERKREKIVQKG